MIKGIGHVAFKVTDMERSMHFYCNVLGGKKAFSLPHPETKAPWIEYVGLADGVFIELFYDGTPRTELNEDEHLTGYLHTSIEVDDIHEIVDRVTKNGGTIFMGPLQASDKNWQAWVRDPDGNRIEFMQMDPDSPQCQFKY